ncbi:hypothetical protein G9A89_005014 [Geosiphon pyriformis]|nr:hypothetical protein G9A89_005014 [Geosiphon pyriformis]
MNSEIQELPWKNPSITEPQHILFASTTITHTVATTLVFLWAIIHFVTESQKPQPYLPNPTIKSWFTISGRGIGLTCLISSLILGIIADLIATINDNSSTSLETTNTSSLAVPLTLWTFSLALKSCALLITLARYYTLTTSLSKEPIISRMEYKFYVYFNIACFVIAYPVIEVLHVMRAKDIGSAMAGPQLFFIGQVAIAAAMFLKLNRRMKIVLTEGLLVGRKAIREMRRFRTRNWYLLNFLLLETTGLLIYIIDKLLNKRATLSINSDLIVYNVINISSALVYVSITLILYPTYDYPPLALPTPTKTDIDEPALNKSPGFSTMRIRSYLKRNNHAPQLSFAFPKTFTQSNTMHSEEALWDRDEVMSEDGLVNLSRSSTKKTYKEKYKNRTSIFQYAHKAGRNEELRHPEAVFIGVNNC